MRFVSQINMRVYDPSRCSLWLYLSLPLAKPSIQLQLLRMHVCTFSSNQYRVISSVSAAACDSLCRLKFLLIAKHQLLLFAAHRTNNCKIANIENASIYNQAIGCSSKTYSRWHVAQLWRLRWRINTSMGIDGVVIQSARSLCVNACLHYNFTPYLLLPFERERVAQSFWMGGGGQTTN